MDTGDEQFLHPVEVAPRTEGSESERERRLRKIIEFNADAVLLVDRQGQRTLVSAGIERITGYTPEEYLSRPPGFDLHPEDVEPVRDAIFELLSRPGQVSTLRCRRLHRDGFYRTTDMTVINHLEDPDVSAIVINVRDVSERAALEEELERSNERLKIALSAARALCWDRDYADNGAWFSSDLAQYYHLPPVEGGANSIASVVHPDDRPIVARAVQESLTSGREFHVEFRANDGGARPRVYASRGAPFFDASGAVKRLSGITWDITETRRLQDERRDLERKMQESQKLESLGVLAGGIAHDFNNILATILGNATLMAESYGSDMVARSFLDPIEEAALRAGDLCKQMLAYAGKGALAPDHVDVNALIAETTSLLRVSINKKAELFFDLATSIPLVRADATQMRQVLMNLVINASDAIGDRPGIVTLRTGVVRLDRGVLAGEFSSPELPEGEYVRIGVTDSGCGMSAETVKRIFEPFFSTKGLGRGLGLAAVLGIVRSHGGALGVTSEPDRGTTFEVLLPSGGAQESHRAYQGSQAGDNLASE